MRERNPDLRLKYSFLRILTGSDLSRRRLPLMVASSSNPGPVVWLTGCSHGDEPGGIVVIQEIFKRLNKNLLKGSVYAFPLMNPIGFENVSRDIPVSTEDLNRSFPGNIAGSLAERIAYSIFSAIKHTNPTLVLDLHNDWRASIPYALTELRAATTSDEVYKKMEMFAKKCGFLVICDTERLEGSISYALLQQDMPSFSLELGESFVINEANVQYGVKAVWNILVHLGMVPHLQEEFEYPVPELLKGKKLSYSFKPLSSTCGIIRFLAGPGSVVKTGQPLAKIYNAFGKLQETVVCLHDGIVLGLSDFSVAFPGAPIMCFGIVGES